MRFPLDHEKLFTHVSLFLHKVLPEDVMLFYSIQFIIHSTKRGRESISYCLLCAIHDSEFYHIIN